MESLRTRKYKLHYSEVRGDVYDCYTALTPAVVDLFCYLEFGKKYLSLFFCTICILPVDHLVIFFLFSGGGGAKIRQYLTSDALFPLLCKPPPVLPAPHTTHSSFTVDLSKAVSRSRSLKNLVQRKSLVGGGVYAALQTLLLLFKESQFL